MGIFRTLAVVYFFLVSAFSLDLWPLLGGLFWEGSRGGGIVAGGFSWGPRGSDLLLGTLGGAHFSWGASGEHTSLGGALGGPLFFHFSYTFSP